MQSRSLAVVGCGMWGRNIARALNEIGVLRTICDANAKGAADLAEEYKVNFTTNLQTLLDEPDITALAIATPASTHSEIANRALSAGKHVFLEKPIALSTSHAQDLAALAIERQRVLMVGHLMQYHPGFVRLLELVRSGELGRINYVYSNRLNQGRIRSQENALWSLAPHDVSMTLSVLGATPDFVSASGAAMVQERIQDLAIVHLAFENGAKAHIFCSWLSPYKEHRFVVIGDRAMAILDDTSTLWPEKTLTLGRHKVEFRGPTPEFVKGTEELVSFDAKEPLKCELEHFLDCVSTGASPLTGPTEAIPVLDVLERAQCAMDISVR